MRIIDRDIEFYDAMVGKHISESRRCHPNDESRNAALRDAADAARNALVTYRRLIDHATP